MINDYIKSLNKIASKIRKKQSNKSPREKVQSWQNFLEELRILDRKYHRYKNAKLELANFDPREEKLPNDKIYPNLCAELQYNLVESAREFHLQIYNTISSFMKFMSTSISVAERRGLKVGKVSGFYTTINQISDLKEEISTLEKSYEFRVFVTHPTLYKSYDWMTFQSQVIYFHPTETKTPKDKLKELQQMLQSEKLSKYVPIVDADDFKCPPEPDITYDSFLRLIKNILRKLADT